MIKNRQERPRVDTDDQGQMGNINIYKQSILHLTKAWGQPVGWITKQFQESILSYT